MIAEPIPFKAQRPARLPVAKLGQRTPPASAPVPDPVAAIKSSEPIVFYKTATECLANRNPVFTQLVEALNLVEVWSTGNLAPEPLPELIEPVTALAVSPKLKQIAERAFKPNQTYSEIVAIDLLVSITNVSSDRARNGLDMMQLHGLLSLTLSNEFYLSASTPF